MQRLISLLIIAFLATPALALTPYTATYKGKISGLSADTHTTLSVDGAGRMEFRSVAKARGMARMFKQDPIVEYTQFEEVDGKFMPIEYRYEFNQSGSKRNSWIKFNHENGVAESTYKTVTVELDIDGHVDRSLELLVVRADLMADLHIWLPYSQKSQTQNRDSIWKRSSWTGYGDPCGKCPSSWVIALLEFSQILGKF